MHLIPPVEAYEAAFALERTRRYPLVDDFEARQGFALDRARLEAAARVLACPIKARPPNWQHGRVLYALTRRYRLTAEGPLYCLDIGTAKGFSALCLLWAVEGTASRVVSVDVVDPESHTRRNTIAECHGLLTLAETLAPWPESQAIEFRHDTGLEWLARTTDRVHVAFLDGKHDYAVVLGEGRLLAARQRPGDVAVFDDAHLTGVAHAIEELGLHYRFEAFRLLPERGYVLGVRR